MPHQAPFTSGRRQLVDRCGSYVEITPSREGIRILGTGSNRKIHRKFEVADGVSVEVYRNCERFITVTGDQISPALDQLADIDAIADQIVAELDAAKQTKQPNPVLHSFEPQGRDLADIIKNGCGTSFGGDKSRAVWFVIHALLEQGRTIEEITAMLIDPNNGISAHLLSRPENPTAYAHRQIRKAMSERAKSAKPPIDGVRIPMAPRSCGSRQCRRCVMRRNAEQPPNDWVSGAVSSMGW